MSDIARSCEAVRSTVRFLGCVLLEYGQINLLRVTITALEDSWPLDLIFGANGIVGHEIDIDIGCHSQAQIFFWLFCRDGLRDRGVGLQISGQAE